jgi:hypothetical protein
MNPKRAAENLSYLIVDSQSKMTQKINHPEA